MNFSSRAYCRILMLKNILLRNFFHNVLKNLEKVAWVYCISYEKKISLAQLFGLNQ